MTKLIQGFREVLTPINLLPNSDFIGRNLGYNYDFPKHYDKIIADGSPTSVYAVGFGGASSRGYTSDVRIQSFRNLTNVDVWVNGDGSIRVKGTVSDNQGSWPGMRVGFHMALKSQHTYTLACEYKDYKNCSPGGMGYSRNGDYNTYYFTDNKTLSKSGNPMRSVRIIKTNNTVYSDHVYCAINFPENIRYPYDFDFTVYNIGIYDGAFTNPPHTSSIDCQLKPFFVRADFTNFPSKVQTFSFQQRNFVNLQTLNYRTFLANKYYDWMIIHTSDTMTSLSYDGLEYINIRGINYYPDGNQTQANAYEMKIFWHEISYSTYRGARAVFIETPIIKQSSAASNNISNVAEFRLVKADYQTWKLQWKVGTINASYTQTWLGEIDVYGRIINALTFTSVTADYLGGTDKWVAYD